MSVIFSLGRQLEENHPSQETDSFEGMLKTPQKMRREKVSKKASIATVHFGKRSSRSLSLQSDIANYLSGVHNTALLVVLTDPCEQGSFDNIVICMKKKKQSRF